MSIVFVLRFFVNGIQTRAVHGAFDNRSYEDSELFECPGNNGDVFMFVDVLDSKYDARLKMCPIDETHVSRSEL
jgi:hypothetical protein